MRRRHFIAGASLALAIGRAQAQQTSRIYRIALAEPVTPVSELNETENPILHGFFEELRRLGYAEERNLLIERFSGEGQAEHYPGLARDVVRGNPDLIFVIGTRILQDFKASTATIPIVAIGGDPVRLGIVPSLARPGGNITGASLDAGLEITGKRLEVLKEAVPQISNVGLLASRAVFEDTAVGAAWRETAEKAGIRIMWPSNGPLQQSEYRRAFAVMTQAAVNAVIVLEQVENWVYRRLIIELSQKHGLPAIYPFHEYVDLGGLIAYGFDLSDVGRRAAATVVRILKGQKPGEIPIYQPTKFELSINLKTAKALGMEMPSSLVVRADKVIE